MRRPTLLSLTLGAGLALASGLAVKADTVPSYGRDYVNPWEGHAAQLAAQGCRVLYVQPRPEMGLYEVGRECPLPAGAGTVYPFVPDGETPMIGLPTRGYDTGLGCPGNRPQPTWYCHSNNGWAPGPPR